MALAADVLERVFEQYERSGIATAEVLGDWRTGALRADQLEHAMSEVAWDIGRFLRRTFHARRRVERITWSRGPTGGSAVAHLADGTRLAATCILDLPDVLGMSMGEVAMFFGMTARDFMRWYAAEGEQRNDAGSVSG
jgi:hypothetical protein